MTNEEALKWLTDLRASLAVPCGSALSEERKQFAEAVDVAIAALERDRWISVNQRLPKKGHVVLAQGLRSCTTGQFQGITTAPRYWWWKGHTIKEVTHWRPLPEPPKEET